MPAGGLRCLCLGTERVMSRVQLSRVKVIIGTALVGLALAGCSAMPDWMTPDFMSSKPSAQMQPLRFESDPPGADVRTTQGQTCLTPCAIPVPSEPQSVTITKIGFVPQTVQVSVGDVAGPFILGSQRRPPPWCPIRCKSCCSRLRRRGRCTASRRPRRPDGADCSPAAAATRPSWHRATAAGAARTLRVPTASAGRLTVPAAACHAAIAPAASSAW